MRRIFAILLCAAAFLAVLLGCSTKDGENAANSTENSTATENRLPQKNDVIEGLGRPDNVQISSNDTAAAPDVYAVLESCRISGSPGNYRFSFDHPNVPEELHLEVSFWIYKDGPEGDLELASYRSDGSWLARPSDYDPSARKVTAAIELSESLSDKYVMVAVKCFGRGIETESAVAIHDYDGAVSDGAEAIFAWSK